MLLSADVPAVLIPCPRRAAFRAKRFADMADVVEQMAEGGDEGRVLLEERGQRTRAILHRVRLVVRGAIPRPAPFVDPVGVDAGVAPTALSPACPGAVGVMARRQPRGSSPDEPDDAADDGEDHKDPDERYFGREHDSSFTVRTPA